MDQKELISRLREYNRARKAQVCSDLEKQCIKYVDEHDYLYTYINYEAELPVQAEEFIRKNRRFKGLLGEDHERLCLYLGHIQEYSCNDGVVRMDVRSKRFSRYRNKVLQAVWAFYLFYGAGLSLKELIYGEYRDLLYSVDFSQVIAAELLAENPEAVRYCMEALTSENNTAVLTRGVIIGVEQSHNRELQETLLRVFLAARLQEGFRQSVVETADENGLPFFRGLLDVIQRDNLLRFSSVQRAVLTWIGIGWQEVKEKDVRYIFDLIVRGFKGEDILPENPLEVYIRLYCMGALDVEAAVKEACGLLGSSQRYIVASALVYLSLTKSFHVAEHLDFPEKFGEDEWIMALFFAECIRTGDYVKRVRLSGKETEKLYLQTEKFLKTLGSRKTFSSKGFEWFQVTLTKESLCLFMIQLLEKHATPRMAELFLPYAASTLRWTNLDFFMGKCFPMVPESARKRFMEKEIISSNEDLGKWIVKEYGKMSLTEDELLGLEGRLTTKKARARAYIVEVLAAQKKERVQASYDRLKDSKSKTIRESALELRKKAGLVAESEAVYAEAVVSPVEIKGREEGFGLYEPEHRYELESPEFVKVSEKGLLKKEKRVDLKQVFPWNKKQVTEYIRRWGERIQEHEDDEYYTGHEYRQVKDRGFYPLNYKETGLDALPLGEVWRNYFQEDGLEKEVVFEICFLLETTCDSIFLEKVLDVKSELFTLDRRELRDIPYTGHFETIFSRYFQEVSTEADFSETAALLLQLVARYGKFLKYKKKDYSDKEEEHALTDNRSIYFLKGELHLEQGDDDSFRRYFPVAFELFNRYALGNPRTVQGKPLVEPLLLARAVSLGMLPKEALYEGILDTHTERKQNYYYGSERGQLFEAFRDAYFEGKGIWGMNPHMSLDSYRHIRCDFKQEVFGCLRDALDQITDVLLSMEVQRLNEKTAVTDYVESLTIIRGVQYLLLALKVLEGEDIKRNGSRWERNTVFADVIRHCYPMIRVNQAGSGGAKMQSEAGRPETDEAAVQSEAGGPEISEAAVQLEAGRAEISEAAVLSEAGRPEIGEAAVLSAAHIPEERLVETAMMSSQWIDVIEEVLGWDGFKEACYYFTAHMKQYDLKQKKAEIARYTELEPEDLYDGAFDMDWCKNVYASLGEKRFALLYKASKFLCDNSFHTRARKYADACLGKKGKEVWKKEAVEKRNKDALNAYCICPIEDDADLLERYLYVQQFLKESKQFGAKRQASEKRAAEMALMNLAKNSRFETVTRLSWMMESEEVQQNQDVLTPRALSDGTSGAKDCVEAWIEIDSQGRNEIHIRKNGKNQKSVPSAYKKHEWIVHLKEIHARWQEQYKRSRRMLEQAMEERTEFLREELGMMMTNPIVSPMLEKLVLKSGKKVGFVTDEGFLAQPKGEVGESVRIAHPYDLYEMGLWRSYQKQVFDSGLIQPFKQVFRELYLKLPDELDLPETRRYSGYQIQTKKAAAALKSRKWNVSYENGLERVYYKDNLVVNLYAQADWFSPGDIEAPAIEYVAFYSRKDGSQVLIRDIDPVTFSETMRDVDMAVSTAYVGGVDPVTSFSTMELRRTIAEYTSSLMKLPNVTVKEHFADIEGGLNHYSVHLGSGVVHQSGGGTIHIVPVHSGKRGKVYLPFLDEDPKTAEILSKIVMLAEDGKIKDPEILRQIVRPDRS